MDKLKLEDMGTFVLAGKTKDGTPVLLMSKDMEVVALGSLIGLLETHRLTMCSIRAMNLVAQGTAQEDHGEKEPAILHDDVENPVPDTGGTDAAVDPLPGGQGSGSGLV